MPKDPLVDALGVRHAPAGDGARIVSLVPSITELLFELGLAERVVGRTTFCVHPRPAVERLPRVGGTKKVRLDKLRALAPSHVIVNVDENTREDVDAIAAFTPNVIVTHPLEPLDNPPLYRLLGGVFGCAERAEALCAEFEAAHARLAGAARAHPPRRVLYLIWRNPWMTVSRSTYISRVLELVRWTTVRDDPDVRYPEVRMERGCLDDVDLVLFSSEPFPFKDKHMSELRELTADTRTPFVRIDGEMTSWYGSRAIEGLRYMDRFAREVVARS